MQRQKRAIIVVDLTYGDAGKGSLVDYLARQFTAPLVVRFNGGAQAAHNVVTPDKRHHTFAQFGSGMFVPGSTTCLSQYMILDPLAMRKEAHHLAQVGVTDAFARTTIDRRALITTPYHQAANQYRELARGADRHGSCGMGIGETVAASLAYPQNALRAGDLADPHQTQRKLAWLRDKLYAELRQLTTTEHSAALAETLAVFEDKQLIVACAEVYADFAHTAKIISPEDVQSHLSATETLIFEGAQGVLLDECYGFHPYTTWSTTTFENAETMLGVAGFDGRVTRLGATRAYATRHGVGPFVTEDADLTRHIPDVHNVTNTWQQQFRVGYFDAVTVRYALRVVGGVDALAVTNLDRLSVFPVWRVCNAYIAPQDVECQVFMPLHDEVDGVVASEQHLIQNISPPPTPTLEHQTHLTALLAHCRPQYQTLAAGDVEGYIDWIAEALGYPVAIHSFGPTATAKQATAHWRP